MANAFFLPGKEGLLNNEIKWMTGAMRLAAVRGYTFDSSHKFIADITTAGGTIGDTTPDLDGKTAWEGRAACSATSFTPFTSSSEPHSLLLFQASGPDGGADVPAAEQRVILWVDTAVGVPFTLDEEFALPVFPGWYSGGSVFAL